MKNALVLLAVAVFLLSGCAQAPQRNVAAPKNDLASLEQRTKATPRDGDLQFALGQEYMRHARYAEAAEAFKKSYGNSSPIAETWSWHWAAQAYERNRQYDAAITAQKRAIELNPNHAENYVFLARLYYSNRQYDETITAANQAISLQSTLWVAHHYLGAALGRKGRYADAMTSLKRASELAPNEPVNYAQMGEIMLNRNAFSEASAYYQKATHLAPQDAGNYNGAAVAHYRAGRYDEAIAFATQAIERVTITGLGMGFNETASGYMLVLSVHKGAPANKAGIQAQDHVTEIDGKSTQGMDSATFAQTARGAAGTQVTLTIERGGASFQKTIVRETFVDPIGSLYFSTRSLSYRHKGDAARALEDAQRAMQLAPTDQNAIFALGSAYLAQGQNEQALKTLEPVNFASGQLVKATALARHGKIQEAVELYVGLNHSEINVPIVPIAKDRTAFFQAVKPYVREHRERARSLEAKGQHGEALAAYSEAMQAADDTESQEILSACFTLVRRNPALGQMSEEARKYAIRSEVLIKEGNFADGLVEIHKAIKVAPYIAQFYFNAAFIHGETKQYREAIRNMKIYLAAAPDSPQARTARDEIIKWELMIEKGK